MNPDDTAANRSDARRAQIIAAARDLYEERGLSHTTVKDITERVGVTRTLFYHYFPDKDAVTSAVIDDYTQDYIEALAHWNEERIGGRHRPTRSALSSGCCVSACSKTTPSISPFPRAKTPRSTSSS